MKVVITIFKILWWVALVCALYFFALELLGYGGNYYGLMLSILFMSVIRNRIYVLRLVEITQDLSEAGMLTVTGFMEFLKNFKQTLDERDKSS
jgi:hypothetical protein